MKRLVFAFLFQMLIVLSITGSALAQTDTPSKPQSGSWKGTVSGKVVNQTAGAIIVSPLELMLHGYNQDGSQSFELDGKSETDGTYKFPDIDFQPDIRMMVMATYEDAAYHSEMMKIEAGQTNLDLTVPIYESTNDIATVSIETVHLVFYFEGQDLSVTQVYVLGNQGDRTVKDAINLPDGQKATMKYLLPAQAKNVVFDDQGSSRYVSLTDGFADTAPLLPGSRSGQVVVSFSLPYQGEFEYLFQPPAFTESISVLIPVDSGLSVQGEDLVSQGVQSLQGMNFELYSKQGLNSNQQLKLAVSGMPSMSGSGATAQSVGESFLKVSNSNIIYGSGVLGLVLVIVGVTVWRRSKSVDDENDEDFEGDVQDNETVEEEEQQNE